MNVGIYNNIYWINLVSTYVVIEKYFENNSKVSSTKRVE